MSVNQGAGDPLERLAVLGSYLAVLLRIDTPKILNQPIPPNTPDADYVLFFSGVPRGQSWRWRIR